MADSPSRLVPSVLLASTPPFTGLGAATLEIFDREASWVDLAGGETLFRQGEPADAMYVVVRGSLQVLVDDRRGGSRHVDTLGRGAVLGEMALLLNETRTASVLACRDSELLRIDRSSFDRMLLEHPQLAVEMARMLGARLKRTTRGESASTRFRTLAVVPAADLGDALAEDFARRLAAVLNTDPSQTLLVTSSVAESLVPGSGDADREHPLSRDLLRWMSEQEDRFPHVLYVGSADRPQWTRCCIGQADLVLVVARTGSAPAHEELSRLGQADDVHAAAELVLLHDSEPIRGTAAWIESGRFIRHHHVRAGSDDDYRRLARFLTGRAVGLVLSGGGARGFAHIGVIRALLEHAVPIDLIAGTSMGAVIAALHATGVEPEAMTHAATRAFVARQEFDLTVPMVSLNSAAATVKKLKRLFGDVQIEDLPIPYFCVTTNLSRAESMIHDRGALWFWNRVSCSIPGLAPPVACDGDLLVDGGLLNNLPADIMRARCDGIVIGVDVTPDVDLRTSAAQQPSMSGWPLLWDRVRRSSGPSSFPTIVDILSRTALVGSVRDATRMQSHCDLYLRPDVDRYGMSDFKAIDALVDAGYRAATAALARWKHGTSVSNV